MNIGAPELIIVLVTLFVGIAFVAVPIVAIVDISRTPTGDFERAGAASQTTWILIVVLTLVLCGIGSLIASLVWFLSTKPKIVAANPR